MSTWINFKELRTKLDFHKVLEHYGVEVKRRGTQHHGFCPLPDHQGKKNSPSFSANLERGIFQCFGCGAKGNLLEFAALMEKVSLSDGLALRKVALKLQEKFCPNTSEPESPQKPVEKKEAENELPIIVNAPLDFELKGLDPHHRYLKGRGFMPETVAHFGLGFASRGLFKDRVVIPLRDHEGKLIGYAGRMVDDSLINEDNPRYRFPGARKREGVILEFRKSLFLYNGYRIEMPIDDLIVVEGFTGVWWLHQNGFPHVVSTMGSDCSEKQATLLVSVVKTDGRIWIMPDGDEAGGRFAESLLYQIAPHRLVRWVKLQDGKQPTDQTSEELHQLLHF